MAKVKVADRSEVKNNVLSKNSKTTEAKFNETSQKDRT